MSSRRVFLRRAVEGALGPCLAPSLAGLVACAGNGRAASGGRSARAGYGPLERAGPELALPEGFRYVRFGEGGTPLSDGAPTPGGHDGMACFPSRRGRNVVRLVRNHELLGVRPETRRAFGDPSRAYDPEAPGGTTTLEVRLHRRGVELTGAWPSLTGTANNCAGGPTPWGTWLSCEETTIGTADGYPRDHGYVFEVPADLTEPVDAVPLTAMGRFVHEAVAVDPATHVVYLTEDMLASGFFRFLANARPRGLRMGSLREGGRLQMLALRDAPAYDTRRGQQVGASHAVRWVDIDEANPSAGLPSAVFAQGHARGGAIFGRLEGAWWGDGSVYFHATTGGDAGLGQVWRYWPGTGVTGGPDEDGGRLALVFESSSADVLAGPDNITVSPRGGLVLCEDADAGCRLHGLAPTGEIFPFALNTFNRRELAGACFSPDGRVLFVNIQGGTGAPNPLDLGSTLAIWGPWERGSL